MQQNIKEECCNTSSHQEHQIITGLVASLILFLCQSNIYLRLFANKITTIRSDCLYKQEWWHKMKTCHYIIMLNVKSLRRDTNISMLEMNLMVRAMNKVPNAKTNEWNDCRYSLWEQGLHKYPCGKLFVQTQQLVNLCTQTRTQTCWVIAEQGVCLCVLETRPEIGLCLQTHMPVHTCVCRMLHSSECVRACVCCHRKQFKWRCFLPPF